MAHTAPQWKAPRRPIFPGAPGYVAAQGASGRPLHALLGLAYLIFYWNVYFNYLTIQWGYAGMTYRPMAAWEFAFAAVGVTAVAFALPTRLARPSSLIMWLLFAFVYVPTMAQTFMIGERAPEAYVLALTALTAAMLGVSVFAQAFDRESVGPRFVPGPTLAYAFVAAAAALGLLNVVYYRDILTLADITNSDDVYAVRFAAADMTSGIIAYIRLYYAYVVGPGTIAIALSAPRYRWLIAPGLSVFLINYMVDGSKISLMIPLAMFAMYAVVRWARSSVLAMTAGMAALTLVSWLLTGHSPLSRFVADLILFRSIATPGQQFALYYDLFDARGYTFWSNIRGFNLILPPPASFAADPRWPVLGQIVGEEYYGVASQNNSNANMFAGEGVAAAGPLGILVIAVVFAAYLRVLDRAALGWGRAFVLFVVTPVALALTNVHLSTMLLSYGGAFWVLFLTFLKPGPPALSGRRRP